MAKPEPFPPSHQDPRSDQHKSAVIITAGRDSRFSTVCVAADLKEIPANSFCNKENSRVGVGC